jgi:hypothetical protein
METIENGIVWRDVPSLKHVEASRCGMIRTKDRAIFPSAGSLPTRQWKGRILRDFDNGHGYRYFTLSYPFRANYYVHRVIAETWCDNPHQYNEINHKDFNRRNNHADNLEWVSRAENMQHNVVNDRVSHGERSGTNKLLERDIISILNEFVKKPTLNKSHLAKRYGVMDTTIHKIVFGKRWTRVYKKWLSDYGIDRVEFSKSVRRWNKVIH